MCDGWMLDRCRVRFNLSIFHSHEWCIALQEVKAVSQEMFVPEAAKIEIVTVHLLFRRELRTYS